MDSTSHDMNDGEVVANLLVVGSSHAVNFHDADARDDFNSLLDDVTIDANHPGMAYAEIRGLFSEAGYTLPHFDELGMMYPSDERIISILLHEGDEGVYFYFGHGPTDLRGTEILSEVMTEEELEELFNEDE